MFKKKYYLRTKYKKKNGWWWDLFLLTQVECRTSTTSGTVAWRWRLRCRAASTRRERSCPNSGNKTDWWVYWPNYFLAGFNFFVWKAPGQILGRGAPWRARIRPRRERQRHREGVAQDQGTRGRFPLDQVRRVLARPYARRLQDFRECKLVL